jgi:hypothetical protein
MWLGFFSGAEEQPVSRGQALVFIDKGHFHANIWIKIILKGE